MNWIDTPLLVYSVVEGHPAQRTICHALSEGDWCSSVLVLLEVYQVLIRHYNVGPQAAGTTVRTLGYGPISWEGIDLAGGMATVEDEARHGLEGADAALLALCTADRGTLYSLVARLLRVARRRGLLVGTLLDRLLRDQVVEWEAQELRPKGLPRLLNPVDRWLHTVDPAIAERFREATNGLTRLPI